jgi:hypothetical protein
MSESFAIRSYHVVVDATPESVYDFVSDVNNMPRWAIHFCKAIRPVAGGGIVTTPGGEMFFGITGDRKAGVIDWWAGPTKELAERWPTRVVTLPDGRALYQVTAILRHPLPPNIDEHFADELELVKRIVEEELAHAWEFADSQADG